MFSFSKLKRIVSQPSIHIQKRWSMRSYLKHNFSDLRPGDPVFHQIRRMEKYQSVLKRLQHPPMTCCFIHGIKYELPYRWPELPLMYSAGGIPIDRLQTIVGFLDGTSCLQTQSDYLCLKMSLSQPCDAPERLLEFMELFGGSIALSREGSGRKKHCVGWKICSSVPDVCRLLATVPSRKQMMYKCAAEWPPDLPSRKAQAKQMYSLRDELQSPGFKVPENVLSSLRQLGGLFDADMTILSNSGIALQVHSIHEEFVLAIKNLLESEGLPSGKCYIQKEVKLPYPWFKWRLRGFDDCKLVLDAIRPYLVRKKMIADTFCSYPSNDSDLQDWRDKMASLKGHMGLHTRLDSNGLEYSKHLNRLHTRAYSRRTRGKDDSDVQEEIRKCSEHKNLHQLSVQTQRYRDSIKSAISNGSVLKHDWDVVLVLCVLKIVLYVSSPEFKTVQIQSFSRKVYR